MSSPTCPQHLLGEYKYHVEYRSIFIITPIKLIHPKLIESQNLITLTHNIKISEKDTEKAILEDFRTVENH